MGSHRSQLCVNVGPATAQQHAAAILGFMIICSYVCTPMLQCNTVSAGLTSAELLLPGHQGQRLAAMPAGIQ